MLQICYISRKILFACYLISVFGCNACAMSRSSLIIDKSVNLKGDTLKIPTGQKLVFKKEGCLKDGVVEGEMIAVYAGKKRVFDNITLSGTFTANKAYSEWFGIKGNCELDEQYRYVSGNDYLQEFKNLFLFDKIDISPGTYMISGGLSCITSQEIEGNGATIKCMNKGVCLSVGNQGNTPVSSVKIRNLNIVGSKFEYTDITEYWHGISISYGENIKIVNVNISYCRGDGIYIGGVQKEGGDNKVPKKIYLNNVNCLKNYRQGMSITRGKNIYADGCSFTGTSGTLPYCGVDIEPNMNAKTGIFNECENIRFSKCRFDDNDNPGLMISAKNYISEIYDNLIKNVFVEDCTFKNNDICVYGVNGLTIRNSSLQNGEIRMTAYGRIQDVKIEGVTVDFDKENTACGYQLSLLEQPCKNINLSNFEVSNCGVFGVYVTRGRLSNNGKPAFQLDGLTLNNIKVSHCVNSIFVSEYVRNATYGGITIMHNGVARSGKRMKSKYGQNFYFEKLDDKNTRIER